LEGYFSGESETYSCEHRLKCKDGDYKWVLDRGTIILRDLSGEPLRMIGTHADISAIKEAEQHVIRLNAELELKVKERTEALEAANKELESFAYSVSHDLRTPLRAIDGFTHILQEDFSPDLPHEANELLDRVSKGAQRMGVLIDELLAYSRMGRAAIKSAVVNMESLARTVFEEGTNALEREATTFRLAPLPKTSGDSLLLRQVWENLIGNALKYSSKEEHPDIEVGFEEGECETVYFVRDNGVGFDMSYYGKLFGVFQRLHTNREFEGTGVGLAIAHRIISRHGGRIWAEGQVGKGATFYFALPHPP
jgi:light-regulated signal transduction histidine kinase (bacteriophytochrome)